MSILLYNIKKFDKELALDIKKLILIGASTGGPGQIQKIVKTMGEKRDSAVVIVQHMQSSYLVSFANQLNKNSKMEVTVAKENLTMRANTVYVLEENYEIKEKMGYMVFYKYNKKLNYSPNIDLLFNSVANIQKSLNILCVVLTGIGDDGARGALALAKIGSTCINEDENSSIVYGMPKAASELNPSAMKLGIDEICDKIRSF